ncbi:hypothetical protein M231_03036 [Tremella mesenterica]|uniref:Uncharacterized protein n=1 Tax=Tremella mesenterica TaxID=5217 RepID=A0A4Q1BPI9_TREME|nr:hypothetical protein M231_03036 [Tremella mesenterica]
MSLPNPPIESSSTWVKDEAEVCEPEMVSLRPSKRARTHSPVQEPTSPSSDLDKVYDELFGASPAPAPSPPYPIIDLTVSPPIPTISLFDDEELPIDITSPDTSKHVGSSNQTSELKRRTKKVVELKSQLNKVVGEKDELQLRVSRLEEDARKREEEVLTLKERTAAAEAVSRSRLNNSKISHQMEQTTPSDQVVKISELESLLGDKETAMEDLEKRYAEKEEKLSKFRENAKDWQNKAEERRVQKEEIKRQLRDLEDEQITSKTRTSMWERSREQMNKKLVQLEKENMGMKVDLVQVQSEKDTNKKELEELKMTSGELIRLGKTMTKELERFLVFHQNQNGGVGLGFDVGRWVEEVSDMSASAFTKNQEKEKVTEQVGGIGTSRFPLPSRPGLPTPPSGPSQPHFSPQPYLPTPRHSSGSRSGGDNGSGSLTNPSQMHSPQIHPPFSQSPLQPQYDTVTTSPDLDHHSRNESDEQKMKTEDEPSVEERYPLTEQISSIAKLQTELTRSKNKLLESQRDTEAALRSAQMSRAETTKLTVELKNLRDRMTDPSVMAGESMEGLKKIILELQSQLKQSKRLVEQKNQSISSLQGNLKTLSGLRGQKSVNGETNVEVLKSMVVNVHEELSKVQKALQEKKTEINNMKIRDQNLVKSVSEGNVDKLKKMIGDLQAQLKSVKNAFEEKKKEVGLLQKALGKRKEAQQKLQATINSLNAGKGNNVGVGVEVKTEELPVLRFA